MGTVSPKRGQWDSHENCLRSTESSKIKLRTLRPLSLSHVHVSFESLRQMMVIRGSIFRIALFFGGGRGWGWILWYATIPRNKSGEMLA